VVNVPRKEKLTLSVDKEVVEKAKELGINISEITEKVLKGFTFEPTKVEESQIREGYKELFHTMQPLIRKFDLRLKVGEGGELTKEGDYFSYDFWLLPDGTLHLEDSEENIPIDKLEISDFLPPTKIMEEFIKELSEGVKKQKQRLKEIKAVQQIIKAVQEFIR